MTFYDWSAAHSLTSCCNYLRKNCHLSLWLEWMYLNCYIAKKPGYWHKAQWQGQGWGLLVLKKKERTQFKISHLASSLKLAMECAWTALLSRWFHSVVVHGKEFLYWAGWDSEASVIVSEVVLYSICGVEVNLLQGLYESVGVFENVLGIRQAPTLQPHCRRELVGAVFNILAGRRVWTCVGA